MDAATDAGSIPATSTTAGRQEHRQAGIAMPAFGLLDANLAIALPTLL
jgi:hypothetical protein